MISISLSVKQIEAPQIFLALMYSRYKTKSHHYLGEIAWGIYQKNLDQRNEIMKFLFLVHYIYLFMHDNAIYFMLKNDKRYNF